MNGDLIEARLLLIRAEIHLDWLCRESRAARELVADIQKFLTLSDSFNDSCGTVEGHGRQHRDGTGCCNPMQGKAVHGSKESGVSALVGTQAPPAGIETASEKKDAGAGAEASSAPDRSGAVAETGPLTTSSTFRGAGFSAKPPSPPVLCNHERPSIVKARKP